MDPIPGAATIRRRFVRLADGRHVHYRRAGHGPPLLLLHPGIASGAFFLPDMPRWAARHTVFAFDNAGFGDSDPLTSARVGIAELAEGLAEALQALAMPPAVLFGYHSGAAVAVELAARHPRFVSGLVVDGMPIFTAAETEALFAGDFAPPLAIDPLGGHFAQTWTRFRDQAAFYPWHDKRPERMLPLADAAPADSVDRWVRWFFASHAHYAGPFRDAHDYGRIAADRIAALAVPASFVVASTDFLVAHAERLPPLRPGLELHGIGADPAEKRALLDALFERHSRAVDAPADAPLPVSGPSIARHFIDVGDRQLLVRSAGAVDAPPLMLLHDAPGSGADVEALLRSLAERFRMIAPDLPGSGGSDALPEASMTSHVDAIAAAAAACGVRRPVLHGIGFGSAFALAAADRLDARGVVLQGLPLPDAAERAALRERYVPPIDIQPDGSHWFRAWQMLRDAEFHFPWFDRRRAAQRRVPVDLAGERLHRRTVAVMDQREHYGDAVRVALADDLRPALAACRRPLLHVHDRAVPLSAHDHRLRELRPDIPVVEAGDVQVIATHFAP